jgi:hypothetical protein
LAQALQKFWVMETIQQPIVAQLHQIADEIRKLGGEVRLQIHLGNMDLKKAWNDLEPKLAEADRLAENASEEAFQAAKQMLKNLKHIHTQLPKKQ